MSEVTKPTQASVPRRGRFRPGILLLLSAGAILGIAVFALANRAIIYVGTNDFCATACHTMKPADESYRRSVHFANAVGVQATCSDCHVLNESTRNKGVWQWAVLVAFKARVGLSDVFNELRGTIATPEKWEAERARLGKQVHAFVKRTDSSTCRGCHELHDFGSGTMHQFIHADVVNATNVDCLACHNGIAHLYEAPAPATMAVVTEQQPTVGTLDKRGNAPGPLGDMVSLGKQLFFDTPGNPLSRPFVGKDEVKSCGTCHRAGGTDLNALPLFGAAAAYPAQVDGRVMSLQGRIADCFIHHLDGVPPPFESKVLVALDAYVTSLSAGKRMAMSASGGGPRGLKPVTTDAGFWSKSDIAAGKSLYSAKCIACHGANGGGGAAPALWGPKAFNAAAALAKPQKLTTFVATHMGAYAGGLTTEQARDLAAFIDSQPRPDFVEAEHRSSADGTAAREAKP